MRNCDWEQRKLGDTVQITMGQSPNGENYTDNPRDHILVQGNADMKNGRVCPRVWTTQVTKKADPEDIILSVRAPVGDVGRTDYTVVLGRGVAGIKGNAFIFQTLSRMKEQGFWTRYSSGSTFESINSSDLKDAFIQICHIEEQTKIGDFFTKLDDTIALHQQKLTLLEQLKQTYLQKLFPQSEKNIPALRFAGFSEHWEQRKLGELASFSKGAGYTKGDLTATGKPIILYGRLYTKYETVIENVDTFVDEKEKSVISAGNEVIVPASGETSEDISRASVVAKPGIILGGDLNVVKPNTEIDPSFLALTISNGRLQKELSKKAQGKSVVHLHNSDLKEVNLVYPNKEEQTKIGTFFKHLDDTIALHQSKLQKLAELKKTLLAKMLV